MVDWMLIVVTNDSNISSNASIFSSIFSLVTNKEDFKEARDDNSVPVHESTEALVILDASDIISLTLDIWFAIELNSVTQSMKSEQSVDFNIFLDVMDSIEVVTSSIALDISWRLLIFSNTSFLGKAVVIAWDVWTFKVVINAGVKEVDWIFKVESITDVFASLVVNTYVSVDAPWGVDGKLTENETRVDWSTEDVINWVDDGRLLEVSLLVWSIKYVLASVVLNKNVDALVFGVK